MSVLTGDRVPHMTQSIPGKPDFPALPRISSRGSIHTTVACGTALWESLVGKPPAKTSMKATDFFIHAKGSMTLLLQLGRKVQVHEPARDEDCLPCGDCRSTPRSMSALERKPQVLAPTPHKVLCRCPAPVDPGNSKGGRRWCGKTCLFINVRLD